MAKYCLKSSIRNCKAVSYGTKGKIQNSIKVSFDSNCYVDGHCVLVAFYGDKYMPLIIEKDVEKFDTSKVKIMDADTEFVINDNGHNNQSILLPLLQSNSEVIVYFEDKGDGLLEIYGVEKRQ